MSTERRIPLRIANKKAYVWDVDGAVFCLLCKVDHVLINSNEGQTSRYFVLSTTSVEF
jgi:hypothetical protein